MRTLAEVKAELRQMMPELRDRWAVGTLAVFGSYARGAAREDSDLDLLVDFERPVTFSEVLALEDEIGRRLGVTVETVTRPALKPHIGRRILAEAQQV